MDELYAIEESAQRLRRLLEDQSMQILELRARIKDLENRPGDDYLERCYQK